MLTVGLHHDSGGLATMSSQDLNRHGERNRIDDVIAIGSSGCPPSVVERAVSMTSLDPKTTHMRSSFSYTPVSMVSYNARRLSSTKASDITLLHSTRHPRTYKTTRRMPHKNGTADHDSVSPIS
jgi:hypothetical protein